MMIRLIPFLIVICSCQLVAAETYKTANFVVTATTAKLAREVALTAEDCREQIAIAWFGKELPGNWKTPCKVRVRVGRIGASGATTFKFKGGEVYGWDMQVNGTRERILDSVVPHEVSHTIFASHFRRPLPRWADEGAATIVEHISEKKRQLDHLSDVMRSGRRIPLRNLLEIKEYPKNQYQVLTMYAEGFSLADFLVEAGGRKKFLQLIDLAHKQDWEIALQKIYGLQNLEELDNRWKGWIVAGSPRLPQSERDIQLASATKTKPVVRGQNPEFEDLKDDQLLASDTTQQNKEPRPPREGSPNNNNEQPPLPRLQRPQPQLLRVSF